MVALGGFFATLFPGSFLLQYGDEAVWRYSAIQLFPPQSSLRANACNRESRKRLHAGYLPFSKYANLSLPPLALCTTELT